MERASLGGAADQRDGRLGDEAMAAKIPIIASAVGAVPKIISENLGILVKPGETDSLADAILYILQNHEKSAYQAQKSYEKVKNDFSVQRMAERYVAVYQALEQ